jgi:hypothetical protein
MRTDVAGVQGLTSLALLKQHEEVTKQKHEVVLVIKSVYLASPSPVVPCGLHLQPLVSATAREGQRSGRPQLSASPLSRTAPCMDAISKIACDEYVRSSTDIKAPMQRNSFLRHALPCAGGKLVSLGALGKYPVDSVQWNWQVTTLT